MDSTGGAREVPWTLEAADRFCARLAQTHYENFTVGSWLLPKSQRRQVYAIYAYCRTVDDLGDEEAATLDADIWEGPSEGHNAGGGIVQTPNVTGAPLLGVGTGPGQQRQPVGLEEKNRRLALLDWWEGELRCCYTGAPTHPVMVALQRTISDCDIPAQPFLKLIEANRMDQRANRYATYSELLNYCDHSANPVGHLFLYLFGYRDEERQRLSDATCTALQLINFWQDVARDYSLGRVYLPQEDLQRFGCTEEEIASGLASQQFRQLLALQVDRVRALFREGAPLVHTLEGAVKLDVALFTRGGCAIMDAIVGRNYDVLSARPALSRTRKVGLFASTWLRWKLRMSLLPKIKDPRDPRDSATGSAP